jgi:transposase-like protein
MAHVKILDDRHTLYYLCSIQSSQRSSPAPVTVSAVAVRKSIEARRAARQEGREGRLIVDYLNRGVSVAEIAARLGVTDQPMRANVREVLASHMPGPPEEFVALQVSRLNEALLLKRPNPRPEMTWARSVIFAGAGIQSRRTKSPCRLRPCAPGRPRARG